MYLIWTRFLNIEKKVKYKQRKVYNTLMTLGPDWLFHFQNLVIRRRRQPPWETNNADPALPWRSGSISTRLSHAEAISLWQSVRTLQISSFLSQILHSQFNEENIRKSKNRDIFENVQQVFFKTVNAINRKIDWRALRKHEEWMWICTGFGKIGHKEESGTVSVYSLRVIVSILNSSPPSCKMLTVGSWPRGYGDTLHYNWNFC